MKRIIVLMLVLCPITSLFAPACAETVPLRFVTNAMNLVEDWLEEHHPDVKYEIFYDIANSLRTGGAHTAQVLEALQSEDGPDEDGFGRETYYDWWFFDDCLQSVPGLSYLHSYSWNDLKHTFEHKAILEMHENAVKLKRLMR